MHQFANRILNDNMSIRNKILKTCGLQFVQNCRIRTTYAVQSMAVPILTI